MELIIDPDGMQIVNASLLSDPSVTVRYIKEVCDPCQAAACAYPIGQFLVSDFCLPAYFDVTSPSGGRYSWNGNLRNAWEIVDGGTLSWLDANNNLNQIDNQNGTLSTSSLGPYSSTPLNRREFLHSKGHAYDHLSHADREMPELGEKLRQLDTKLTREAKRKHKHFLSDISSRSNKP
jgi:hypothetical protein